VTVLEVIIALFLPPLSVAMKKGLSSKVLIAAVLQLCGHVPVSSTASTWSPRSSRPPRVRRRGTVAVPRSRDADPERQRTRSTAWRGPDGCSASSTWWRMAGAVDLGTRERWLCARVARGMWRLLNSRGRSGRATSSVPLGMGRAAGQRGALRSLCQDGSVTEAVAPTRERPLESWPLAATLRRHRDATSRQHLRGGCPGSCGS